MLGLDYEGDMSDTNRIGSACWYLPTAFKQSLGKWRPGHLRHWAVDFDEPGENGFMQFPVGVIEDDETGCCHSIYVDRICFALEPPR